MRSHAATASAATCTSRFRALSWLFMSAIARARHKEAGRVAVTHYVYLEDREKVARYIKRLVERSELRRAG